MADAAAQSRRGGGPGYHNRGGASSDYRSPGVHRHSQYRSHRHHRHIRRYPFFGVGIGLGFGYGAHNFADPVYLYEPPPVYYAPPAAYPRAIDPPYPPVPAYPPPPVADGDGEIPIVPSAPQAALATDDPTSWPLP